MRGLLMLGGCMGMGLSVAVAQEVKEFTISIPKGGDVPFYYEMPARTDASPPPVLVAIPTFNGSGEEVIARNGWGDFAMKHGMVILSPTFTVTPQELRQGRGYYYPDQWSGAVLERALGELSEREKIPVGKVLMFGHSAGAHFVHRFAIWKPERVKAFVAYSAAWWSEPSEAMTHVPALIMCGEDDPRYEPTLQFMEEALTLGLPWIWRSYRGTGHEMTPAVQRMAEAFLAYYAGNESGGGGEGKREAFYGDIQTFQYVPVSEGDKIPEAVRVVLPSRKVAETWAREQ